MTVLDVLWLRRFHHFARNICTFLNPLETWVDGYGSSSQVPYSRKIPISKYWTKLYIHTQTPDSLNLNINSGLPMASLAGFVDSNQILRGQPQLVKQNLIKLSYSPANAACNRSRWLQKSYAKMTILGRVEPNPSSWQPLGSCFAPTLLTQKT